MSNFLKLGVLLAILGSTQAHAAPLSYGGRLTDATGKPVAGPVDLAFRFFHVPAGGTPVLATPVETNDVVLTEGVFQVEIDLTPAQLHDVFPTAATDVFIQVTDTTNNKPYPRQKFHLVPFAAKIPIDTATLGFDDDGKLQVKTVPPGDLRVGDGKTIELGEFSSSPACTAADTGKIWFQGGTVVFCDGDSIESLSTTGAGGITAGGAATLTNKVFDAGANTLTNIDDSEIKAGANIDASKIAPGTVTSAKFGYLANVTSDVQAQLAATTNASNLASGTVSNSLFSAYDDLTAESKIGTGAAQVAAGNHTHTTLGTITSGTWQGTAIADSYIASAATWNANNAKVSSQWATNASDVHYSSGNVGIGTSTPNLRLHVLGTQNYPASSGTTQFGALRLQGSGGVANDVVMDMGLFSSTGPKGGWLQAILATDLSVKHQLVLNPRGGDVAVGFNTYTSNPILGSLQVTGDGQGLYVTTSDILTDSSQGSHLSVYPLAATGDTAFGIDAKRSGNLASDLILQRLGGNVGIGTNNPTAKLHIAGTAGIDGIRFPDGTTQVTASTAVAVRERQTVLVGAVDASGYANFLAAGTGLSVDLAATATPIRLAFAAGFGAMGNLDYAGSIAADATAAWSALTPSTTNYLYVERNSGTGALSYGFSTLAPDYAYALPGSPATGQHAFQIPTMKMYVYNGSAWQETQRVFVGEAVTGASAVTSVVTYALRGMYDSGPFTIAAGTDYTKNSNIGTTAVDARVMVGGSNSAMSDPYWGYNGAHFGSRGISIVSRNTVRFNQISSTDSRNSQHHGGGITSPVARIVVKRDW